MEKKILFADDEEDIRYVTEIILRVAGYRVELTGDPAFHSNMNTADLPDLFLLDRHMFGADMLETCKQLKTDPRTSHIPVIMVSADPHIKDLYKPAMADDFVAKPFERYELIDAVARQLSKK